MEFLSGAFNAKEDRSLFMKTVFLFWLLGAIDGHAKNFSIFLQENGNFSLTPLYDVLSAYPLAFKKHLSLQKMKMTMSLKGKNKHYEWSYFESRHWLNTASLCQFPKKICKQS